MSNEVYVVCREIDGRNLISEVYADRAEAIRDVTDRIGEHHRYTVDCMSESNTDIEVFDSGAIRHIVYPFVLQ